MCAGYSLLVAYIMRKTFPHLPPKTCEILAHRTYRSVWGLLFLTAIAGLASVAVTLSTLVWLVPGFFPEQLTLNTANEANEKNPEIDPAVLNEAKKKLWYIYDKRQKLDGQFYPDSAAALSATMFSSDGWAVFYDEDYFVGKERYWEGIDYQGTSYKVEKIFVDKVSGFIYVKFDGGGFPFIIFADWDKVTENSVLWEISRDRYKRHLVKKDSAPVAKKDYKIWQPHFLFKVAEAMGNGNVLINEKGELVALTDDAGYLLYGWLIDNQYAAILRDGGVDYRVAPWSGYMAHGFVKTDDYTRKAGGFLVTNSPTRVSSSTVGVGDLITKVQGAPVSFDNISRQILFAPDDFVVTVLRGTEEYEIIIKKTASKF